MNYEEIEVKFIIDDLPAMRQRVVAIGAHLKTPRTYEDNLCLDTPDQRLRQQACLLRLRRDQHYLLTYKEPVRTDDPNYKVRHEYEVAVSDITHMRTILERLGFVPIMRYEKYRETFLYQDAEIVLDETPLGAFMEIEGPRTAIRNIAMQLEVDFETRLTASYGTIFQAVCTTYKLPITDMTFDNFQTLHIDLRACDLT
jgi:adenylate cyclase class 2